MQFFEDGDGQLSSSRLGFIGTLAICLGLGVMDSVIHRRMLPLDPTWISLVTLMMAGKVVQSKLDNIPPTKSP